MREIAPCLWFDTEGEEAANVLHVGLPELEDRERHPLRRRRPSRRRAWRCLTVEFELDGQKLIALNGGPDFTFNEAVSLPRELREPGGGRMPIGRRSRRVGRRARAGG